MKWLHLTDIHVGSRESSAQSSALTALHREVERSLTTEVDVIFITGDLAYSGKAEEYNEFERLVMVPLRQLKFCKNARIVAVPGNHDLDCDASSPLNWAGMGDRRRQQFFDESEDGRRVRAPRALSFKSYTDFCKKNGIDTPDPLTAVSATFRINVGTRVARIIATNTAFFSDKEKDIVEREVTPAPTMSLRHHVLSEPSADYTIVIGHHPINWFIERDQELMRSLLADSGAVYLHGHEHKPRAIYGRDKLISLGFGAGQQATLEAVPVPGYQNSFAFCELDEASLRITIKHWDSGHGRWALTTDLPMEFDPKSSGRGYEFCFAVAKPNHDSPEVNVRPALSSRTPVRLPPKPQSVASVFELSEDNWRDIILRGKFLATSGASKEHLKVSHSKVPQLIFECRTRVGADGEVVECISGPGHILSRVQIENANTTIDLEGLQRYTIISLGTISDEARETYVRLLGRKPIKIFCSQDLAQVFHSIQPERQAKHLMSLDAASVEVQFLIGDGSVFLLVLDRQRDEWFYLVDEAGRVPVEAEISVSTARRALIRLERMAYRAPGVDLTTSGVVEPVFEKFDRPAYLSACYNEYNSIIYAALATIGFRFNAISLEQLYVRASADVGSAKSASSAVPQAVGEFLDGLGLSALMRAQVEQQFRSRSVNRSSSESGAARYLYQRYGAILVLGDPGSGKTCFVKSELLAYCNPPKGEEESWYQQHTPLFVPLSEAARLHAEGTDLLDIATALTAKRGLPMSATQARELMGGGHLAMFFDGLDEVVALEDRTRLVEAIVAFMARATPLGNRVIITSRPAAAQLVDLPESLKSLQLLGLTSSEMRILATRVLAARLSDHSRELQIDEAELAHDDKVLVEKLLTDCESVPGIARLARNPLFLTLLVMIYANSGPPAAKRHRIYAQAVQTLVAVRNRQAGQLVLSESDLRRRLGAVALSVYEDPSGAIQTRESVISVLAKVMKGAKGAEPAKVDLNRFIQDVAEATGLLVLHCGNEEQFSGSTMVTFMHHSFLEYYAAVGLQHVDYQSKISQLARRPRWREVVTLLVGIVGDHGDVTPLVSAMLRDQTPAEQITLDVLLFAFDCALECDVPPDDTQELLLSALDSALRSGSALHDSTLRELIGQRVGKLLAACGSRTAQAFLVSGLDSAIPEICAAYVGVLGHVAQFADIDRGVFASFDAVCARHEAQVLRSVCNAMGDAVQLRRDPAIELLRSAFRGSLPVRLAATQAIDAAPGLSKDMWQELKKALDDTTKIVAGTAARAIIKAGLKVDVLDAERDVNKALGLLESTTVTDENAGLEIRCSRTIIEERLSSSVADQRLLGIRLLPWAENAERFAHDRLMEIVRNSQRHEEIAAALSALWRSENTQQLMRISEVERVRALLEADTRDVRIAAARVLSRIVGSTDATGALMAYIKRQSRGGEEFRLGIRALATSGAAIESVHRMIFEEIRTRLSRKVMGEQAREDLVALLKAAQELAVPLPEPLASALLRVVNDFKPSTVVRHEALILFVKHARPTESRVAAVMSMLVKPPANMATSVCRAIPMFVGAIGKKAEYVRPVYHLLDGFRDAIAQSYEKLGASMDGVQKSELGQLRAAIARIEQLLQTYRDISGGSPSSLQLPSVGGV